MNPSRYDANFEPMDRQESEAWLQIEQTLRTSKMVKPRNGFANRWLHIQRQQLLAERKRREAWLAFGNVTAILVILMVILFTLWPMLEKPASILSWVIDPIVGLFTVILVSFNVAFSFAQNISALAWATVGLAFIGLTGVWASFFNRITVGNK
jgi:hypothetical protein